MKKNTLITLFLVLLLLVLSVVDVLGGSVWISPVRLWSGLSPMEQHILWQLRLPKMLTAVLAGVGLSLSGAMMQTLFRNPLAGPYILGVSSGASLGVALLTLCASFTGLAFMAGGVSVTLAAVVGSILVMLLVMALARRLRNAVSLLIVGMMIGSIAGALVSLLQTWANPDALKLFIVWTLGSLGSVGWGQMPLLVGCVLLGLLLTAGLTKPLNGLLLGEDYARGLGIRVQGVRYRIVLASSLLAGVVTAFCGPIAFVGVAVPHLARGLYATSNHRVVLPATALIGANLLLLCDWLSSLGTYALPISTVSALFGAPIILYIILKS